MGKGTYRKQCLTIAQFNVWILNDWFVWNGTNKSGIYYSARNLLILRTKLPFFIVENKKKSLTLFHIHFARMLIQSVHTHTHTQTKSRRIFPNHSTHFWKKKRSYQLFRIAVCLGAIFIVLISMAYPVGNKQNEQIYMQLFQVIKDGHSLSMHYKTVGCGKRTEQSITQLWWHRQCLINFTRHRRLQTPIITLCILITSKSLTEIEIQDECVWQWTQHSDILLIHVLSQHFRKCFKLKWCHPVKMA